DGAAVTKLARAVRAPRVDLSVRPDRQAIANTGGNRSRPYATRKQDPHWPTPRDSRAIAELARAVITPRVEVAVRGDRQRVCAPRSDRAGSNPRRQRGE